MNKTSNLRILHIASGDYWAGAESQLFTLVTTLHDFPEVDVSVVLLNYGTLEERLSKFGINVIVIDESILNSMQVLKKLVHIIREYKPDVVHTHRFKENILGSIAALLGGNVPSMRTVHGAPEHYPSWKEISKRIVQYMDWLTGQILQKRIIAVSDDLASKLRNRFPKKKIRTIENGVDLKSLRSNAIQSARSLGVTANSLRIGIAGRLVPVKRIDIFILTARYILDNYPELDVSFHIIGDGPERSNLENLSLEQNTNEIISFEGHCTNIARTLAELDMLVLSSDHEGMPMILLEAMALDVPVIAHAIGGIPALLDHGSCGLLVKKQSPEGYAEKIRYLCLSSESRFQLAAMAKSRVETHYSAEQLSRAYLLQYKQIH